MPTNINNTARAANAVHFGAEVEYELRKVGIRSTGNRIFPPSFFARIRRLMTWDYLRWQMTILQGFLRVNRVAARFMSLRCHQEVRPEFGFGRRIALDVTPPISSQGILKVLSPIAKKTKIAKRNSGLLVLMSRICVCIFCNTLRKKACDKES
jgi:hypothetical protein